MANIFGLIIPLCLMMKWVSVLDVTCYLSLCLSAYQFITILAICKKSLLLQN